MTGATMDKGVAIEVLGTCETNTTVNSQHDARVDYHHLWSYAQQAALIAVSDMNPRDGCYRLICDPERRAKRIAGHYAQLYFNSAKKSDGRIQFRWPALAAFVVKDIVEAYRFAREDVLQREWKDGASAARNSSMADLGSITLTDSSPYQHAVRTYSALAKGNLWLFMDIYPWLWFFLEYGINPDATLNRTRLAACLPHRNWNTFQPEAKKAVEELPYGPNWMGRLSAHLKNDRVYKKAYERFSAASTWSQTSGYGQPCAAASQAHLYCRMHVKEHDNGYRTPLSNYWGKFQEAYYVMESEHVELGRMADDQAALSVLIKLRQFSSTPAISQTYKHLIGEHKQLDKAEKLSHQKLELVAVAEQEQINVLQPLIYDDPLLKITMDTNHRFSRMTNGWISPKFKVIFRASPTNNDPALEAVFDVPESMLNRFTGSIKSLPDQDDRMKFVSQIAKTFNDLMSSQKGFMENELRKIGAWVNA
jgi:hypothetical protein